MHGTEQGRDKEERKRGREGMEVTGQGRWREVKGGEEVRTQAAKRPGLWRWL